MQLHLDDNRCTYHLSVLKLHATRGLAFAMPTQLFRPILISENLQQLMQPHLDENRCNCTLITSNVEPR